MKSQSQPGLNSLYIQFSVRENYLLFRIGNENLKGGLVL